MTNVPFSVFVMEMNIAHFEAMLKLDMDEENDRSWSNCSPTPNRIWHGDGIKKQQ